MLQSSYTSRRLADRIRILRSDRYELGEGRLEEVIDYHLGILVYLHTISSVVVRLCPKRNAKVI